MIIFAMGTDWDAQPLRILTYRGQAAVRRVRRFSLMAVTLRPAQNCRGRAHLYGAFDTIPKLSSLISRGAEASVA